MTANPFLHAHARCVTIRIGQVTQPPGSKMASANLSFTQDGLIYHPQHFEDDEDDEFLSGNSQKDGGDICRVCRTGSTPGRPLFHPCLCTGSIKFIHQECLVQWLKHSGKSHCELCKHEFVFNPIYHPSMPQSLSFSKFFRGVLKGMAKNVRHWLHLSLVAFVWLFIMPVCIYRIYRVLFYGTLWSFVRFPLELISLENLASDGFYGLVIVLLSLLGFISVVWLQDQIRNGGGPQWLEQDRIEGERREAVARDGHRHQQADRPDFDEEEEDDQEEEEEEEELAAEAVLLQLSPRRREAARAVEEIQEKRSRYMKQLQEVQSRRFDQKLEHLRVRELELSYDLGAGQRHFMMVLRGARMKQGRRNEGWRERHRVRRYREETGDEGATPPESYKAPDPIPHTPPPSDWGEAFTPEEVTVMQLIRRERREMDVTEREETERRLEQVRQEQRRILRNQQEHTEMICQVMTYGEHYVFGVTHPDEGKEEEEETEVEGWDADMENAEVGKLLPVESALIRRLRVTKFKLVEATRRKERIAAGLIAEDRPVGQDGQNEGGQENRRWYNRLLGRPQNDAVAPPLPPRPANNRPNIGRALVGLARDRPPEPGRPELNEEITWARLLGLDGTYRFLEHVLWLICLVSALIMSFIFVPYQIGRLAAALTSLWDVVGIVTWRGAVATFIGYIVVCCVIIAFYYGMGWIRLPRVQSVLGVMYVAIKVGMILAVEAGIFPLLCGWWIDICAFGLFGSTLSSRQESLQKAPGTIMFLHWLAGMIFIFYLASFVMLLREVLRPGVLWFLRNLNDQNFHPIQEMIGLPMQRHLRRFVMSCLMFGVCVMFALFIPSRVISFLFPSFLPFNLTIASSISPIREIQLELILLQFVVPTLLEHGNSRAGLKFLIKHWARLSAYLL
ncbi:E3 ubiquitin-protein ligase MARCHF6 [Geodia barretti]|uniref:RING-type E3 ubiquitin transferase n=1 Tax=Geodia barretti TaxID=519541 RepID=A0AA35W7K1_GEOBA|nr:E3 ubiquitin-protein ligase MARCHF6 [Geodia barretti]